jgi:Ca2+-binding EF-hand superfamily protein
VLHELLGALQGCRRTELCALAVKHARVQRNLRAAGTGALGDVWRRQKAALHARPEEIAAVPLDVAAVAGRDLDLEALEREFAKASRRGVMTVQDFQTFLAQAGFGKMPYIYNRLFEAMDRDGSGTLDARELTAAVAMMKQGSDDEKLRLLYRMLDKDGAGGITQSEVALFMKMFISLERDAITTIFSSVEALLGKVRASLVPSLHW